MRDLFQDLRKIGLTTDQCCEVLEWINTLTPEELQSNGYKNLYFPPGDGDYSAEVDSTLKTEHELVTDFLYRFYTGNNIQAIKLLKSEFNLTTFAAKKYLDDYTAK